MCALVICGTPLLAQSEAREFVPFHRFVEETRTSTLENLHPQSRVKEAAALEEMRTHILGLYGDVQVSHSFVLGSDHFDCIPVLQQPATRVIGLNTIATAPPDSALVTPGDGKDNITARGQSLAALLYRGKTADAFGNSLSCEEGTIPMRRITLEETSRFPTLRQYLQKGPGTTGQTFRGNHTEAPQDSPSDGHRYSIMNQDVDNLGGNTNLNLWRPYVDQSKGEVFTLSQAWYVGGDGDSTQTAGGWLAELPG
jgi:hypothetical protein